MPVRKQSENRTCFLDYQKLSRFYSLGGIVLYVYPACPFVSGCTTSSDKKHINYNTKRKKEKKKKVYIYIYICLINIFAV